MDVVYFALFALSTTALHFHVGISAYLAVSTRECIVVGKLNSLIFLLCGHMLTLRKESLPLMACDPETLIS